MAIPELAIDELLNPISEDQPSGTDILLVPEWDVIRRTRQADKLLGRQNTDWPKLQVLLCDCLAHKAKDLRLAMWLAEAEVKLHGFAGLRDSFRLISSLIVNFWDKGLYPLPDGEDYEGRAKPIDGMNGDVLPDAICQVPITVRTDGRQNYSQRDWDISRGVGKEKDLINANGDIDEEKSKRRQAKLAAGYASVEMFDEAVRLTRRAGIEAVSEVLDQAIAEFEALNKILDEKFGPDGTSTTDTRKALESCRGLVTMLVEKKREEEPDQVAVSTDGKAEPGPQTATPGMTLDAFTMDGGGGGSWSKAEELIRAGSIQEGLAEMTRQSAQEYGRVRFQHRLRLAEICLSTNRTRLALAILEELAKQIDDLKLDMWESPELLGRVWGRLYKSYKGDEAGSERGARAAALFDRLCRLDPWQALRWDE